MNSNALKIAALGGGAFLLYRYFSAAPAAAPAKTSTSSPTSTSSTSSTSSTPPPQQTPAIITDQNLKRAAANKTWAFEAGDTQLNWHQWNFYRRAYNATLATPAPEDVGQGDGMANITATRYHEILNAAGLAGFALRAASFLV